MEIRRKNIKLLLVLIGIFLLSLGGISFAYFTIGGKQDEFITFKSGSCLSITITEESDAINLESTIPETIEEGLNHTPYTFKIKNNCSTEAPFQISLESLNQVENSLGVEYIQVSLEDSEGRRTTDKLGNLDETLISNENAYDARKLLNGELPGNSEASYKLRIWLDYDATKEQAVNKTYTSKIVVSAKDNVSVDEEVIKVAFNEEASTPLANDWYQNYTTRVNVTSTNENELKAKYCISNTVCTPNTDATLTSNSFTIDYPNGSNVVCTQGVDIKGNSSKIKCNDVKKVDNEVPRVEITSTTEKAKSITINVSGSDSHSGIAGYKFSSDNGSSYTTKETTENTYSYTITDLDPETAYTIAVQAIDNAGNMAEKVTKEVTTKKTASQTILAGITVKETTPSYGSTATDDEGVYKIADGMYNGDSYVWRGAVKNNWVKFANMYWRIIRINGDGSIRMIYTGNSSLSNVTVDANGITATGTGTQLQTSAYNSSYNRSEYVGYTYKSGYQRPSDIESGTETSSTIKGIIDSWYNSNIANNATYVSKVAEGKYCNDRDTASGYTWSSQPSSTFYYAARGRLESSKAPVLSCPEKDVYTLNAGLITADEVSMAGGVYGGGNTNYYLYTNQHYWTMSPYNANSNYANVFVVNLYGYFYNGLVADTGGIRPVINLKSDTLFELDGTGTYNNPYIVK